jgi:hypothetical protein
MKKILPLFIVLALIFVSCKREEIDLTPYMSQIENLQMRIEALEAENQGLREFIDSVSTEQGELSEDEKTDDVVFDDTLKWLKESSWDEVVVYANSDLNKSFRSITEEEILKIAPQSLIGMLTPLAKADISEDMGLNDYTYLFKKGQDDYKINVLAQNIIEINGQRYQSSINAASLGKAVIEHTYIYDPKEIVDKIYQSTFAVRKKYNSLVIYEDGTYKRSSNYQYLYYADGMLVRDIATAILNITKKMENSPLLSDNINSYPLGEFKVYHQAIAYRMDVYNNYIHIYRNDTGLNLWYMVEQGKEELYAQIIAAIKK